MIKKSFSLVELLITIVAIALIAAAFSPVVSKRLISKINKAGDALNISTYCEEVSPSCSLCDLNLKRCINCQLQGAIPETIDQSLTCGNVEGGLTNCENGTCFINKYSCCYDSCSSAIEGCQECTYDERKSQPKCKLCEVGYYLNDRLGTCIKCTRACEKCPNGKDHDEVCCKYGNDCKKCNNYQCIDGQPTEPDLTTIDGQTLWTLRNAGDENGIDVKPLNDVIICPAQDVKTKNELNKIVCKKADKDIKLMDVIDNYFEQLVNNQTTISAVNIPPICWQGNTAVITSNNNTSCTDKNGYSGCTRMVCNWNAANIICEQSNMHLPTSAQMEKALGDINSFNPNNPLNLCSNNQSNNSCLRCPSRAGCVGSNLDSIYYNHQEEVSNHTINVLMRILKTRCIPSHFWTKDFKTESTTNPIYYTLDDYLGDSKQSDFSGSAKSVRCAISCSVKYPNCAICGQDGKCRSCDSGYYLDEDKNCVKCDYPCKTCSESKTYCTSCENGYYLNNETNQCIECPANIDETASSNGCGSFLTINIDKKIFTARNPGDTGGPLIPVDKVQICKVGDDCSTSNNKPTCWQGATSGTNCDNNDSAYSGCNRTVCNWSAGNIICENIGMSLPSKDDIKNNVASLHLCSSGSSNSNYSSCNLIKNCKGSGYYAGNTNETGYCIPQDFWLNNKQHYYISNVSLQGGPDNNSSENNAKTVRCIKKCSDFDPHCINCNLSRCTDCEDKYFPSQEGKCIASATTTNGVTWTTRNAGEYGGPQIPWGNGTNNTVVRCFAGEPCSGGGTTPTCWIGQTSDSCSQTDLVYDGCNRPVCNWYAGNIICQYNNMSLPTEAQAKTLRLNSGSESAYNAPDLHLCDFQSYSSGNPPYSKCAQSKKCNGATENSYHNTCLNNDMFTSNKSRVYLMGGVLKGPVGNNANQAASIRCVE